MKYYNKSAYILVFVIAIILVSVLVKHQLFDSNLINSKNKITKNKNTIIFNRDAKFSSDHKFTYIVFIQGLGSRCNGTRYGNIGFSYIRRRLTSYGFQYRDKRFLQYSYTGGEVKAGKWFPNKYGPEDTGQPIEISVKILTDLIRELSAANPNAQFIIVGHSLGGVIAFDFTSKYKEDNGRRIKGVVTLDAPLSGYIYNVPNIVLNILENNGSVWGSTAVRELILQNEFKIELESMRRQAAQRLQKNGVHLATFATQQDLIVPYHSAYLRDINNKPITEGDIISVSRLGKLPDSLYGHRQILEEDLIVDYIMSILKTELPPGK